MFEKFYERYAPEEKEVIVLIQRTLGAGYDNRGFWDMTVISLGMVFCDTGEVNIREGRLDWPVTEEEKNSEKVGNDLRENKSTVSRSGSCWMNMCRNILPLKNSTVGQSRKCWNSLFPARS